MPLPLTVTPRPGNVYKSFSTTCRLQTSSTSSPKLLGLFEMPSCSNKLLQCLVIFCFTSQTNLKWFQQTLHMKNDSVILLHVWQCKWFVLEKYTDQTLLHATWELTTASVDNFHGKLKMGSKNGTTHNSISEDIGAWQEWSNNQHAITKTTQPGEQTLIPIVYLLTPQETVWQFMENMMASEQASNDSRPFFQAVN